MRLPYLVATAFAVILVSAKPDESAHEAKDKGKGRAYDLPSNTAPPDPNIWDIELDPNLKLKTPIVRTHSKSRRSGGGSSSQGKGKDNADDVDDCVSDSQASAIQREIYREEVQQAEQKLEQRVSSRNLWPANDPRGDSHPADTSQQHGDVSTRPSSPETVINLGDHTPGARSVIFLGSSSSDNSSVITQRRSPILPLPPVQKPKEKAVAGPPPGPPLHQDSADEIPRQGDQGPHFAEYHPSSSPGSQAATLTLRLGATQSPQTPTSTLRLPSPTPTNSRRSSMTLTVRLATPTASNSQRSRAMLTFCLDNPTQAIIDHVSTETLTLTLSAAGATAVPEVTAPPFSAPASGAYAVREERVSVSILESAGTSHRNFLGVGAGGSPP